MDISSEQRFGTRRPRPRRSTKLGGWPPISVDGAHPVALFVGPKAALLTEMPAQPFKLAGDSRPKVVPDGHIQVSKALYLVPQKLIGGRCATRWIQIRIGFLLLRRHRPLFRAVNSFCSAWVAPGRARQGQNGPCDRRDPHRGGHR